MLSLWTMAVTWLLSASLLDSTEATPIEAIVIDISMDSPFNGSSLDTPKTTDLYAKLSPLCGKFMKAAETIDLDMTQRILGCQHSSSNDGKILLSIFIGEKAMFHGENNCTKKVVEFINRTMENQLLAALRPTDKVVEIAIVPGKVLVHPISFHGYPLKNGGTFKFASKWSEDNTEGMERFLLNWINASSERYATLHVKVSEKVGFRLYADVYMKLIVNKTILSSGEPFNTAQYLADLSQWTSQVVDSRFGQFDEEAPSLNENFEKPLASCEQSNLDKRLPEVQMNKVAQDKQLQGPQQEDPKQIEESNLSKHGTGTVDSLPKHDSSLSQTVGNIVDQISKTVRLFSTNENNKTKNNASATQLVSMAVLTLSTLILSLWSPI